MSAKKPSKKANKHKRSARKALIRPGLAKAAQRSRTAAHEFLLLVGPLLVILGFFQPWLIVETASLAESLFGLPPSASLNAPALPAYAHEVEKSWVVELLRLFEDDHPQTGRIWWVYASPISALLSYFWLRSRSIVGAAAVLLSQGFVALLGLSKQLEGLAQYNSDSLEVHFGYGLAITTLGHGILMATSLKVLDRSLMRRISRR